MVVTSLIEIQYSHIDEATGYLIIFCDENLMNLVSESGIARDQPQAVRVKPTADMPRPGKHVTGPKKERRRRKQSGALTGTATGLGAGAVSERERRFAPIMSDFESANSWSVNYFGVPYDDARKVDGVWWYRSFVDGKILRFPLQDRTVPLFENLQLPQDPDLAH